MTEVFRNWILSLTATALFCSIALAMAPKGRAGGVLRLVCGIALSLALIAPLIQLDLSAYTDSVTSFSQTYRDVTTRAEEQAESLYRGIIEEECAAYIWDKAERCGMVVTAVSVTAQWDDVTENWLPHTISIDVPSDTDTAALSAAIETELGIPAERQEWNIA
ncbi:MAG: hypothetical protein ACOX7K_03790 [Oscillospiraceae bacterium]|jgi:hypothetical protein